jgi:hypothetical protein
MDATDRYLVQELDNCYRAIVTLYRRHRRVSPVQRRQREQDAEAVRDALESYRHSKTVSPSIVRRLPSNVRLRLEEMLRVADREQRDNVRRGRVFERSRDRRVASRGERTRTERSGIARGRQGRER